MDDVDSGVTGHSTGQRDVGRLRANDDSSSKNVGSPGVSQISTLPVPQSLYGLLREVFQSPRSDILLELLIPPLSVSG